MVKYYILRIHPKKEHKINAAGGGSCGRDEFADFELKLIQASHLTDGFTEFYCLYLQSITHSIRMGLTSLELVDFCAGTTFYLHLEERLSKNYRYYIDDEDEYLVGLKIKPLWTIVIFMNEIAPRSFE